MQCLTVLGECNKQQAIQGAVYHQTQGANYHQTSLLQTQAYALP